VAAAGAGGGLVGAGGDLGGDVEGGEGLGGGGLDDAAVAAALAEGLGDGVRLRELSSSSDDVTTGILRPSINSTLPTLAVESLLLNEPEDNLSANLLDPASLIYNHKRK